MRKFLFFTLLSSIGFAQVSTATDHQELTVEQVSEAMGHLIGKSLQDMGVDFDLKAIVKGLQDQEVGIQSPLSEDECVQAITHMQEEKMENVTQNELKKVDALSNGDLLPDLLPLPPE